MSQFAMDLFERALKTFAQALLACFVGNATLLNINWGQSLGLAGTAALVSVLTSLSSATFTKSGGASLVNGPGAALSRATQVCTSCVSSDTVQSILPQDSDGAESRVVHSPGPRSYS